MQGRREEGGVGERRREKEKRADSLARMDPCCLAGVLHQQILMEHGTGMKGLALRFTRGK